jgi:hypothetical protein
MMLKLQVQIFGFGVEWADFLPKISDYIDQHTI